MTGLSSAFTVRVRMLSDWIVGTGEGRVGDVDATVRRDGDGLPFIPAKTLTGIWRDACEQVADWLCPHPELVDNPWQAWVDWIFGSQPDVTTDRIRVAGCAPQPAALTLSPARLPLLVRTACRGRPALQAAAVVMRPGVKIDGNTGVALSDMLRLEERARPGVLEADIEFAIADGDVPVAAELLLRAGAATVDGLGGKRNRGAGRCWLLLPGMTDPDDIAPVPAEPRPPDARLADLSRDAALLDSPGVPPERPRRDVRLTGPRAHSLEGNADGQDGATVIAARTIWRVTFEVVTPVVAQHRVLGNVLLGRDWVPGSLFVPEILARLDRLVGHRDLVVGDARPAAVVGQTTIPGLPAPMTWYRSKDWHGQRDVVNAAIRRPDPSERRKPMREAHIAPVGAADWLLLDPEMSVSTHAVIGDDAGRPDQDRGGVFTYLGLAPGTLLISDVVLPEDVGLALGVGDRIRLGRSRKDDFGEVEIRDVQAVPTRRAAAVAAGTQVQVWCVSDVLLLDPWGAPDPSPQALAAELTQRAVPVSVVPQAPGGPVIQASRAARRDSFHTRWGRPRPSLIGLAAGSVVTLTVDETVSADALVAVQRDGIGERTAEGFGQVRFDAPEVTVAEPHLLAVSGRQMQSETAGAGPTALLPVPEPMVDGSAPTGAPDGSELPPAPNVLEEATVKAEIARQVALVMDQGADRVISGAGEVRSRAQWGSLREQLPRLRSARGREAVARWLEQTGQVRQRRDAWGDSALRALERLLTDETAVWSDLGLTGSALNGLVLASDRADAVRAFLWPHAVSVLITEIARDATRRLQAPAAEEQG